MARKVYFEKDEFILRLTGAHRFFALKHELIIPYRLIQNAFVDYFRAPVWMLKMPGTAIGPLNIYEGSFRHKGKWYFLSYSHKVPLVQLELVGYPKYSYVIFEMTKPQAIVAEINKRRG